MVQQPERQPGQESNSRAQQEAKRPLSRAEARRQRRIARRRKEILAAAARVFGEKGYANTTTREIAYAADMAEGTLYNYFDGKREILLAIIHETQGDIEDALDEVGAVESREELITFVARIFEIAVVKLSFTRTLLTEAWLDDVILEEILNGRLQRISDKVQYFIEGHIAAGNFRPMDPELATRILLGMFIAPILPALRGVASPPSPEQSRMWAQTAVDLLLNGVLLHPTTSPPPEVS